MNPPFILILAAFTFNAALTIFSNFAQRRKIANLEMSLRELSDRTVRLLKQNEQILSMYLKENKEFLSQNKEFLSLMKKNKELLSLIEKKDSNDNII